jgi:nucleotidyltransferase/DNA polymerase involved in DNA repair
MQITAAPIEKRQRVLLRADGPRKLRPLQQLHRGAATRQLRRGLAQPLRLTRAARRAQRTVVARLASDAQPPDQVEHEPRRAARQGIHAAAEILAISPLDLVRIPFQSGIDLASIAP